MILLLWPCERLMLDIILSWLLHCLLLRRRLLWHHDLDPATILHNVDLLPLRILLIRHLSIRFHHIIKFLLLLIHLILEPVLHLLALSRQLGLQSIVLLLLLPQLLGLPLLLLLDLLQS